jgi:hypothetical protein
VVDTICDSSDFALPARQPNALFFGFATTPLEQQRFLSVGKLRHCPVRSKFAYLPRKPFLVFVCGVDSPVSAANLASNQFAPILSGNELRNRANLP